MSYIGIDLGTTNSAICSFDGEQGRLFKSPEQNDVTPSAIFIDRRGNRFVGTKAYNNAARNPESAATLFKRFMGSSTPIELPGAGLVMTPEECSAEIVRTLCGYVDEEIWRQRSGTVVTVPAAFDQMQKTATMKAAELADVGPVALMQEPVAAVMSVVRSRQQDGRFVVFDIGGGTLDVAVAECLGGRVSLLGNQGISMCGGREFDLALYEHVVGPWLARNFSLPADLASDPRLRTLRGVALWACERAKIELSQRPEAVVALSEVETGVRDLSGNDIYLDVPIDRPTFDRLIEEKVTEAVKAVTESLTKAGLSSADVDRIVFVGGPTHYKPLRDRVAHELRIASSIDVNPMTAVAEGAAVFAESIDWSSESRGRKASRGSAQAAAGLDLAFNYESRTPKPKARIVARSQTAIPPGMEFKFDSLDTGWDSGRVALRDGAATELPLAKPGENAFKVWVFDASGRPVPIGLDRIVISRTAATIDAIPASHSIGIEVKETLGGPSVLDYLVKAGDHLPAKGKKRFLAGESLAAGSGHSLKFKLWEGDATPISSNRPVGMFEIRGIDFDEGEIPAGTELICEFEVLDSGQVTLEVAVPSKQLAFQKRNFYSPVGGQVDYSKASQLIAEQVEQTQKRIDQMSSVVSDKRLEDAQRKLDASTVRVTDSPETARQAMENLQDAKRMIAETRQTHLREIRRMDLDRVATFFDGHLREYARPSEASSFDSLVGTAERAIPSMGPDFEAHLSALWSRVWSVAWRQDWFIIERFNWLVTVPHQFPDAQGFEQVRREGAAALAAGEIDRLRHVVGRLLSMRVRSSDNEDLTAETNVVRK